MFQFITTLLVFIVCVLFITKRWNEAKIKRDVDWCLRPGAGIVSGEKKPSIFPYLFK
jgi:hypothetical protein